MAQLMTIRLSRQDVQPWGFRLHGGTDFGTPLIVQKVNAGSIADQAGIIPGDAIIKINNVDVFNMRHKDAQDLVVRAGHTFDLTIQRGGSTWRPSVTPTGSMPSPSSYLGNNISAVTKTSLAHRPQEVQHIGCGYNNTSRPFSSVNGNDGPVKSIINKQYNTPVGIYSEEAIAETLSAQAEVLAGGVLGVNFKKNEKIYNAANSEVLKMLHEQENDKSEPVDSQQQQQHLITSPTLVSHQQQSSLNPVTKHVIAPIDRPKDPNSSLPAGQNICSECERLIVGVFIRIKDKNLHSECFKCATCGTSLKNQGYFNFKNKLYCDVHARLAAINSPPKGTEGHFPVPIKPTQKLSASTISAALDAHVQQHDGSNHIKPGPGGPRPFNNNPMNAPMRGPQSPSIYPPPNNAQSWGSPLPKPKPQTNPYATLPHAVGQSQGHFNTYKSGFNNNYRGPLAQKPLPSGLHKPDNIPQYQRNWTVLSSQRPIRTPEPPELKENVPLAFAYTPHELTASPVVTQTISTTDQHDSVADNAVKVNELEYHQQLKQQQLNQQKSSVPIIVTDMSGPISMTFQSLDDVPNNDHTNAHPRPFTPSLINKPAPIIPYYQTTDKLVAEECSAMQSRSYDPHSPSSLPDRTRSPAPGPPPNPLKSICAPRTKELQIDYRQTQPGSITTGQSHVGSIATGQSQAGFITTGKSYYGAQTARYQTKEQGQIVSHYESGQQMGGRTLIDKPEVIHQKQIGDMTIKTRAKENQLNESNHSELKSKSTTQVGNMQIERNRKVVEEFEHNQSSKSIEILKTRGETRQIGKTEFFANQASNLSGLEQEISSITSQSQAISARANLNDINSSFPQYASSESISKFPLKPILPTYDEPQRPTYVISNDTTKTLASSSPKYYDSIVTNTASSPSNYGALSSTSSFSYNQSRMNAANQSSIKASSATSSNLTTTSLPVPDFKPPVPFGSVVSNHSDAPSNQPELITNNQQLSTNTAYKPAPSIGPAGFKLPLPPSSNIIPNVVNDPSPASAGSSKGGVFSATSVPKRGRGILNKAVGPGVRVPLCGSCNSHIRGPFITALGRIWCPDHFVCVNGNCRRALQDIGFVEEKGDLYCEYCFEKFLAPTCNKCTSKIKGDCLNAIGKHFHPECFTCSYCGKVFGNSPFFLEEGEAYCEADWNELFTTKCFACGFPVEAGDRWVEALNHNYHSQCFNCTMCRKNLEGQSFYNKGGRPFCKNHAR